MAQHQAYFETYHELQTARLHKAKQQTWTWKLIALCAWVTFVFFVVGVILLLPTGGQ